MTNQLRIKSDLEKANAKDVCNKTRAIFDLESKSSDLVRELLGFIRSEKTGEWVKGGKALIALTDCAQKTARLPVYTAIKLGFILSESPRLKNRFAGLDLVTISSMDRDQVLAHKLTLTNGNKKAVTKSQKAAVEKFVKAQASARNTITTGLQSLRDKIQRITGVAITKGKNQKAPKITTANGKDSKTSDISNDNEIESGEVTEAKGILPPAIRDPRLTTLFNQVTQLTLEDQAAFYEVAVIALKESLLK